MAARRSSRPVASWSRRRLRALLATVAALGLTFLAGGLWAALPSAADRTPSGTFRAHAEAARTTTASAAGSRGAADRLAARPMPAAPATAAQPAALATADPGIPLLVPGPMTTGEAGVPSGFPHTPAGALAQLAAIDQAALEPGSLDAARRVIEAWALPGGPTSASWSGVHALAQLLSAAGLSGAGSAQLAVVLTPVMGLIKGMVGADLVVPCIDFEADVTLLSTARAAVADCQRMAWAGDRWQVAPGAEPAVPPSIWPDTAAAFAAGYRDLRHE